MDEARYRQLVEQLPVVTYIAALDDCHRMLYLSPQIATLTGFPAERWSADPAFFVNRLVPEDRPRVLEELARCRSQGSPLAVEYRLQGADGRTVWVSDEAQVVRDAEGRPQFRHGVITDITRRRVAEELLRQAHHTLRALIQASPLAIFMLDPQGLITTVWNAAAERLFGWSAAEVMGKPLPIIPTEQQGFFRSVLSRVLQGEVFEGLEVQRLRRDGTLIDLSLAASPLLGPEGKVIGVLTMLADITQRKRAEAALSAASRDATVGRMAAVVAHEINNPLAAIKAWLGLLRADLVGRPEVGRNLELIGEQVDRITRTVRNLLGFSRQRELRDVSVTAAVLIGTVTELFAGRLRTKGIRLEVSVPESLPAFSGDVDQLQEVFINLLENACQVLDQGRRVVIDAERRDGMVEVRVEDDGPGLGPDPERVFTPFYTTRVNGTGLGLTVARRICEAHGGQLLGENVATGGACFRVILPMRG
jgi:PAS domain S-box-containing protein